MKLKQKITANWSDVVKGAALLIMGVIILCVPSSLLTALVVLFGVIVVVSGAFELYTANKIHKLTGRRTTAHVVSGAISLIAGVLLVCTPAIGQWMIAFAFALWLITQCLSRIADFSFIKQTSGTVSAVVTLVLNVLGVLLGVVLVFNPVLFTLSVGVLLGLSLVVLGIGSVVKAFTVQEEITATLYEHKDPK